MPDTPSFRPYEISELTPLTSVTDLDKTLISHAGRSGPASLSVLFDWIKTHTDDLYAQLPSTLGTSAAETLGVDDKLFLSHGDSDMYLRLGDLYIWVKSQTDSLYSKLPDTSSKGGQVLVVAADGTSFVWSGATTGPLLSGVVLSGTTNTGGTGVGATRSINGNGRSGQITITTGTTTGTLAANALLATVTFAAAFPAAPRVFITPGNANAAKLATPAYVSSTTTGTFLLNNTAALTASTPYIWNFLVEL